MAPTQGIPPEELPDADLERELRHLYDTRAETFFHGSDQALERHTERTLTLEAEYARRNPPADPGRRNESDAAAGGTKL